MPLSEEEDRLFDQQTIEQVEFFKKHIEATETVHPGVMSVAAIIAVYMVWLHNDPNPDFTGFIQYLQLITETMIDLQKYQAKTSAELLECVKKEIAGLSKKTH